MNNIKSLCALRSGECGRVIDISPHNPIRQRLFDIGLIKGTLVRCLFGSPTGGMKAYMIRGATIAIRAEDCKDVDVEICFEEDKRNENEI